MVNVVYFTLYSYVYLLYTFVLVSDTRGGVLITQYRIMGKRIDPDDRRDDVRKHSGGVVCHGDSGNGRSDHDRNRYG